jgi:integrase
MAQLAMGIGTSSSRRQKPPRLQSASLSRFPPDSLNPAYFQARQEFLATITNHVTRAKVQELSNSAKNDVSRRKWLKLELALVLAEATGRRPGSIRQLQWEDFDYNASTIRWRAEADKNGVASTVPIPSALRDEIRVFQVKLGGGFGGFMFPSHSDQSKALTRDAFGHWLRKAEELAELPKLDGSLWHAYRRAWASARKDLPLKDVAAVGGWKDIQTLVNCYQQADDDTMLLVMSHPKKISERGQIADLVTALHT